MAKKLKNIAASEQDNNSINKNETSTSQNGEIFAEIEKVMKDGSYRDISSSKEEKEEEAHLTHIKNEPNKNLHLVEDSDDDLVVNKSKKEKVKKEKKSKEDKIDRKKKKVSTYEKTTFLHKMKVLGVLCLLGVFTGSGLGVWYFNFALKSGVDYSQYDPAEYVMNIDSSFSKIGIAKNKAWVEEAKANGLSVNSDKLNPEDIIALCTYNAENATSYEIVGIGEVYAMGTKQTVYSGKKFDGTTYTFESISKGIISVATCDVMTTNDGLKNVAIYSGSKPSATSATWKYKEKQSVSQFKENSGVLPTQILPYIISGKTIASSTPVTQDDEGNYTFTLKMKKIESVLYYYKQVKRSGDLGNDPEFYSIEIKFTVNDNWEFVSTQIKESYKAVKFGAPVTCKGSLTTTYAFNQQVTLPILPA